MDDKLFNAQKFSIAAAVLGMGMMDIHCPEFYQSRSRFGRSTNEQRPHGEAAKRKKLRKIAKQSRRRNRI